MACNVRITNIVLHKYAFALFYFKETIVTTTHISLKIL